MHHNKHLTCGHQIEFRDMLINTVKPAHAVTSIKQALYYKKVTFSCPVIENLYELNLF